MARFTAQDGTQLFGWWQPADRMPGGLDPDTADRWGQHTVLLCHGVGGGKETQADFARFLNAEGYNVLLFDFRGYGDSGGNWISYGDRERADVLAAAIWIKVNHAQEAQLLYGIGLNTGAAALLGATAQAQGQFDGLVLIEPFADFDELARTCSTRLLPDYARVLAIDLALPVASLHAGADLRKLKPVEWAARAWPSPILVIHGNGLAFVPAYQSMSVFQQASFPKDQFWPSENWSSSRKRIRQAGGDGALLSPRVSPKIGGFCIRSFASWRMPGRFRSCRPSKAIGGANYDFVLLSYRIRGIESTELRRHGSMAKFLSDNFLSWIAWLAAVCGLSFG
jgi:hypothetical protein